MTAPALRHIPEFRVAISGHDIPAALRNSITSVRYEDGTGAADRVELGVANVDLRWLQEHIRGLGFQPFPTGIRLGPTRVTPSDGLFDVDNKLTPRDGLRTWRARPDAEGEITGVQASFPSGGVPGMTIVAHDYLHRLTVAARARLRAASGCADRPHPEHRELPRPAHRSGGRRRVDGASGRQLHLQPERAEAKGAERLRAHAGARRRPTPTSGWKGTCCSFPDCSPRSIRRA